MLQLAAAGEMSEEQEKITEKEHLVEKKCMGL